MKLVSICPTFRRSKMIPNVLAMWNRQDYPAADRHLIILDDGGTFDEQHGDNWSVITLPERVATIGQKFGQCCELARSHNPDAIVVWEDDDVYLPWHLSAAATTLGDHDVSCPSLVLADDGGGGLHESNAIGRHHGAWSFTVAAYDRSGGYPHIDDAFDFAFRQRLLDADCSIGDPISIAPISYVYRWFTTGYANWSAIAPDQYAETAATIPVDRSPGPVIPQLDELAIEYFAQLAPSKGPSRDSFQRADD